MSISRNEALMDIDIFIYLGCMWYNTLYLFWAESSSTVCSIKRQHQFSELILLFNGKDKNWCVCHIIGNNSSCICHSWFFFPMLQSTRPSINQSFLFACHDHTSQHLLLTQGIYLLFTRKSYFFILYILSCVFLSMIDTWNCYNSFIFTRMFALAVGLMMTAYNIVEKFFYW